MENPLINFKHNISCFYSSNNIQSPRKSDDCQQPSAIETYSREVKETLNATSKYVENEYGKTEYHINQYILKEEIGRGSFGAVHYAVDQLKNEYAIKEVSKSRLRKRSQSLILKRPQHNREWPIPLASHCGSNQTCTAQSIHRAKQLQNPLYLVKGEIEVAKRVNHPNILRLIEVLDNPEEDSLYMVLEPCMKGVVTRVSIGEKADPLSPEKCRTLFRQMVYGLEHLHKQGIVHRDIKPDNLLLTSDNILKIADFGDSETFEKGSEMLIFKTAGSLAFTPPELCVRNHGYVSGTAADIWSLGISLYCMRFGHLPFEHDGILELYDAIKSEELKLDIDPNQEPDFYNLMMHLLDKDPQKRAKIEQIKINPWFTDNCSEYLSTPEMGIIENSAITQVTETMTSEKQVILPAFRDQRSERETIDGFCPIIFGPILFEVELNINNEYRGTNNNTQDVHTQITASQKIIQLPESKSSRQRNDSGIGLDDLQFAYSNNSFTESP